MSSIGGTAPGGSSLVSAELDDQEGDARGADRPCRANPSIVAEDVLPVGGAGHEDRVELAGLRARPVAHVLAACRTEAAGDGPGGTLARGRGSLRSDALRLLPCNRGQAGIGS